jgi:hypothetical protein
MHRRLVLASLVLLLAAPRGEACSPRTLDANDLIENGTVSSANGRFVAVIRQYESLADFTSERAGKLLHLDPENEPAPSATAEPAEPPPQRKSVTVALYESDQRGRRLVGEIPVAVGDMGLFFVSDSGRFVIAVRYLSQGGCGARPSDAADSFVSVYRPDGTRVGGVTLGDVLTPSDVWYLAWEAMPSVELALRTESDTREVVVVSIPTLSSKGEPQRYEERRIDLATVAPLDEKRSLLPQARAWAEALRPGYSQPSHTSSGKDCAAAWPDAKHIDSDLLLATALDAPLPLFPEVALKARIRGLVIIEAVVSERGDVLCTYPIKPLPFGLDVAAITALRQWTFRPFIVNGQPVKVRAEILFHFQNLDQETWSSIPRIGR